MTNKEMKLNKTCARNLVHQKYPKTEDQGTLGMSTRTLLSVAIRSQDC